MRFAFVACNRNAARFRQDPSFIYRCENPAAALMAAGHEVVLLHVTAFPARPRFDGVIFHRPAYSMRLRLALLACRLAGVRVLADLDDLVADPFLAEMSPAVRNGILSLAVVRRQFARNASALALFPRITVSTEPLAGHVRAQFPDSGVAVVSNAVHRSWRKLGLPSAGTPRERIITYLPGTRSHDRDFAQMADVMGVLLADHPELRLHVTGPLAFEMTARAGQIVRADKVPFQQFHEKYWSSWLNIAPLEPTPFTRCKSALKVMEAGFWGVPTVCSTNPDVERFVGAGAVPAESPDDWYRQIKSLMEPARYEAVTARLRERVLERADIDQMAERLLHFVVGLPQA